MTFGIVLQNFKISTAFIIFLLSSINIHNSFLEEIIKQCHDIYIYFDNLIYDHKSSTDWSRGGRVAALSVVKMSVFFEVFPSNDLVNFDPYSDDRSLRHVPNFATSTATTSKSSLSPSSSWLARYGNKNSSSPINSGDSNFESRL